MIYLYRLYLYRLYLLLAQGVEESLALVFFSLHSHQLVACLPSFTRRTQVPQCSSDLLLSRDSLWHLKGATWLQLLFIDIFQPVSPVNKGSLPGFATPGCPDRSQDGSHKPLETAQGGVASLSNRKEDGIAHIAARILKNAANMIRDDSHVSLSTNCVFDHVLKCCSCLRLLYSCFFWQAYVVEVLGNYGVVPKLEVDVTPFNADTSRRARHHSQFWSQRRCQTKMMMMMMMMMMMDSLLYSIRFLLFMFAFSVLWQPASGGTWKSCNGWTPIDMRPPSLQRIEIQGNNIKILNIEILRKYYIWNVTAILESWVKIAEAPFNPCGCETYCICMQRWT